LVKIAGLFTFGFFSSLLIRGLSRYRNPDYWKFMTAYNLAKKPSSNDAKARRALLRGYDFDLRFLPPDFSFNQSKLTAVKTNYVRTKKERNFWEKIKALPCEAMTYFVVHAFARPIIFPGSLTLIQKMFEPSLIDGRKNLIENYKGERFKLLASDGNQIDSLFVDRRDKSRKENSKGDTLIICCEGNSGFYECGIIFTPLYAGV